MPHFEKIHPVNHAAQNMFDLVSDIEKYPEFLPLCLGLNVQSVREKGERSILLSDMTVGYKAIRETFTCRVVLHPQAQTITVNYIEGPFKFMENKWFFEAVDDKSCHVHFTLDYEFKSKALALLMGSMFDRAFAHFTQSFEERADALYGKSNAV